MCSNFSAIISGKKIIYFLEYLLSNFTAVILQIFSDSNYIFSDSNYIFSLTIILTYRIKRTKCPFESSYDRCRENYHVYRTLGGSHKCIVKILKITQFNFYFHIRTHILLRTRLNLKPMCALFSCIWFTLHSFF